MDLLWKSRKDNPQSNKTRSISRSQNVVKRLSKDPELLAQYDNIILEQLKEAIVEIAPNTTQGVELYSLHYPVVRRSRDHKSSHRLQGIS